MDEQQINRAFQQMADMPAELSAIIRARIRSETRPVKPMMPDAVYVAIFGLIFVAVTVLVASVLGFKALHVLAPAREAVMLTALAILALCSGLMLVRAMQPASGHVYGWPSCAVALLAYEMLVFTFFGSYSMTEFMHRGAICLSLGVACGVLAGLPIWFIVRRGFVVEPVKAGAVVGLLSGLAGLEVLTLHCPILEIPHTGIWHAGVILVCVAAGSVGSRVFNRIYNP